MFALGERGSVGFERVADTCWGAGANDFTINLKVQSGGREQTATSGRPAAAPPTFTAKAKEVVWVQWSAANGTSGTPLSDITLHVFMDRGDARAAAPKPRPEALYESALIQDFVEAGGEKQRRVSHAYAGAGHLFREGRDDWRRSEIGQGNSGCHAGISAMRRTVLSPSCSRCAPLAARAEHFDINRTATAPDGTTKEAFADQTPPVGGLNPRPVLHAKAGDTIAFQFVMTNVYARMRVRAMPEYAIVRERGAWPKTVPPPENLAAEGSFTFNLKPRAKIGTKERVVMPQPGLYLLRVESQRTQRDHEHFSAIDLEIR